jgi:hypothetical protein
MEMNDINSHDIENIHPNFCPKDPNRIKGGEVQNFVQKKNLAQVKDQIKLYSSYILKFPKIFSRIFKKIMRILGIIETSLIAGYLLVKFHIFVKN